MRRSAFWLALGLGVAACGWVRRAERPPAPAAADVPLYPGLGTHGRPIKTASPEAQRYFNQGLAFVYAFNHDEAIRSFTRAAELDPKCAMAYWGVAYANGPHINNSTVPEANARAAWTALGKAQALAGGAGETDRALITALGRRYADPQPENRQRLDQAYADAMRGVWQAHPDDADVGALFAEAMMDLRPWDLWTPEGAPQPGTEEILTTLETVLARAPAHPLALHLYIHAVEASPHPEKADAAAGARPRLPTRRPSRPTAPTARGCRRRASTASTWRTTATCWRTPASCRVRAGARSTRFAR